MQKELGEKVLQNCLVFPLRHNEFDGIFDEAGRRVAGYSSDFDAKPRSDIVQKFANANSATGGGDFVFLALLSNRYGHFYNRGNFAALVGFKARHEGAKICFCQI